MNCTYKNSLDTSPIEALAGYKARNVAEARILNEIQADLKRLDLPQLRNDIVKRITDDQKQQMLRFDNARAESKHYTVGDLVLVWKTDQPSTRESRKLNANFKGPFQITKVLYNDRYGTEDLREGVKRSGRTVVAVDKIKPWIALQYK